MISSGTDGYCANDTLNNPVTCLFSSFRASLSTSYIIQKNYYQSDVRNFIFLSNADYFRKVSSEKFTKSFHFKTDLGYVKYLDSSWNKYSDSWRLNILFEENASSKITHSYSLILYSQFLNTYFPVSEEGKQSEQWRGGFLNPATLNFSYDVSISFWEYSNALLGLSAIRMVTRPCYDGAAEPKEDPVVKTDRSFILASYGLSGQISVYSKKISEAVTWDNTSSFFLNGISKDRVNFDFENKFTFKFLKYLQFRLETHVVYDPVTSYHLQYRQEFLIGVFYEKRKK